ncbi:MAG: hypothetical protein HY912_20330 [Desulfomonile tiedjei]|uniref:Uncharacterized protein n=1 Tax=Desulfomonile tiedjei TaxID=2358 RepID=A0A9D6Z5U3_9BACT|nr:hypothetical protein [Desulfomonile tiedjei]
MEFDKMSREGLIDQIREMNDYMDNVIVFWGGKREYLETFGEIAKNTDGEYSQDEMRCAQAILGSPEAFDEFIDLLRDSFERGGINYLLAEKVSAIMEEVASRHKK